MGKIIEKKKEKPVMVTCTKCNGSGKIDNKTCPTCSGSGKRQLLKG